MPLDRLPINYPDSYSLIGGPTLRVYDYSTGDRPVSEPYSRNELVGFTIEFFTTSGFEIIIWGALHYHIWPFVPTAPVNYWVRNNFFVCFYSSLHMKPNTDFTAIYSSSSSCPSLVIMLTQYLHLPTPAFASSHSPFSRELPTDPTSDSILSSISAITLKISSLFPATSSISSRSSKTSLSRCGGGDDAVSGS